MKPFFIPLKLILTDLKFNWTVIEAEGYAVGTMCVLGKKLKYFFLNN